MAELLLSSLLLLCTTHASKLWVQENIGEVTHWFNGESPSGSAIAYVATQQNVLACLDVENDGALLWRQVLDKDDLINHVQLSTDRKSLFSLSNGNVLRKWRATDGALLWENRQFQKATSSSSNQLNAAMQSVDTSKIVVLDNRAVLTVYDADDGSSVWKQPLKPTDSNYAHRLYVDAASKRIFVVTFTARHPTFRRQCYRIL